MHGRGRRRSPQLAFLTMNVLTEAAPADAARDQGIIFLYRMVPGRAWLRHASLTAWCCITCPGQRLLAFGVVEGSYLVQAVRHPALACTAHGWPASTRASSSAPRRCLLVSIQHTCPCHVMDGVLYGAIHMH